MKVLRNRKWTSWLLVTAYVALLAHAFIPHHHHGEQTAFLDFKTCPHEQHDHAHGHGDPDRPDNGLHSLHGDCETLKYVLIQDPQSGFPNVDPILPLALPDFIDAEQYLAILPLLSGTFSRSRPGPGLYNAYIALSQGMRAPPALS